MKVSLFITCLGDIFYANAGKATVEILERLGCEVDFPASQTCCGQPAYNSGYHERTKAAARNMIQAFADAEYVVSPSGSCAFMFKEYESLFAKEPEWQQKAIALGNKTYELTQFITDVLKVEDVGAEFHGTATYHISCHMTRLLGVTGSPRQLLSHVKGLELRELPHEEACCGFGGTFSVKMPEISEQMVVEKVEHIAGTEAEVLIGADSGCLMNIGGRIDREGRPVKVMHIAEILNSRGER